MAERCATPHAHYTRKAVQANLRLNKYSEDVHSKRKTSVILTSETRKDLSTPHIDTGLLYSCFTRCFALLSMTVRVGFFRERYLTFQNIT